MKIVSLNLNGLRSALKKGLTEYLTQTDADLYCFQEIKIDAGALAALPQWIPAGYQLFSHPAEKKGYSGVAVLSKTEPMAVNEGCGVDWIDREGRLLEVVYPQFTAINVYLPSGTMGDARQNVKDDFLAFFLPYIQEKLKNAPRLIITGDFNICHQPIDLYNPEKATKLSGFLPHERQWMTDFLALGLTDCFRACVPNENGHYSWFSFRFDSRSTNRGWRIDYHLASEPLRPAIQNYAIRQTPEFSDHCPIELDLSL